MNGPTVSEKPEVSNRAAWNVLFAASGLADFTLPELTRRCHDWEGVNEQSARMVLEQHPQFFDQDSEGKFQLRAGAKPLLQEQLAKLYDGPRGLNPFSSEMARDGE